MTFTRLREALIREHKADIDNEKTEAIEFIKWYLTDLRKTQLKNGELSEEKAREIAIKRMIEGKEKTFTQNNTKIIAAEECLNLKNLTITIEWAKSRTWGANPHAVVWARDYEGGQYQGEGSASGCGYDKESAAIAKALNMIPCVLKELYKVADTENGVQEAWKKKLGYGLGHGILPYFEGGVGVDCFRAIFEKLGFIWKHTASGKTFDVYTVIKA